MYFSELIQKEDPFNLQFDHFSFWLFIIYIPFL